MYHEEDYAEISAQLRRRWLAAGLSAGALIVLALVSFLLRWPQIVTSIITFLGASLFIFCFTMFISPVAAYRRHVQHALHGRTSQGAGVFVEMEEDTVLRDRMRFWPMTINVGAGLRDDGDRLYYYDANLPRPDWEPGESLLLTSYDNRVVSWTRAKVKA